MNNIFDYDYMIEILTALKEGKVIQRIDETTDVWIDHNEEELPKFDNYEYRIKPISSRYRVALFKDGNNFYYPVIVNKEEVAENCESESAFFVRWLSDWIEYEVL